MLEKFKNYDTNKTFTSQALQLLEEQLQEWPFLKEGIDALKDVTAEELALSPVPYQKLFNPARIVNIKADVSKEAIAKRKCFLCLNHLPAKQRGIRIDDLLLLCNPRPIFTNHFTLSHSEHTVQSIHTGLDTMIKAAELAGAEFTVFFNGAQAGASAPDHMHFQVAPTAELPVMNWSMNQNYIDLTVVNIAGRASLFFTQQNSDKLKEKILTLIEKAESILNSNQEKLNLLMSFKNGLFQVLYIPRKAHRPACYFKTGSEQVLLSPACVESTGVVIAPRKEDFNSLTPDLIRTAWEELYFSKEDLLKIKK